MNRPRSAIDQLDPIRASSVIELLESADLVAGGQRRGHERACRHPPTALEAKIVWELPASREAQRSLTGSQHYSPKV